ncbi:MAG: TetR/AcrR family transcriptional regulator [Acidimicrobiales bacterium]
MTFSTSEISAIPAWQARALDRSLADARARSVERLSRFVAAARALATESGSSAFTVQQVVERAGQSLKSFYRLFDGKDDLLLALLEEDCAVGAFFLAEMIDAHDDPVDRVRAWVIGLFELMAAGDQGYVGVLVREYGRLSEERPDQMEQAVAPFIDLLVTLLEQACQAGVARAGDTRRDAGLVFALVLRSIHELALGRDPRRPREVAEHVWSFCWFGMGAGTGTPHEPWRRSRR